MADIRMSLALEYLLIAALTSVFAIASGSAIAYALLNLRIGLTTETAWWYGAVASVGVATLTLGLGARTLLRTLRLAPARLLRAAG